MWSTYWWKSLIDDLNFLTGDLGKSILITSFEKQEETELWSYILKMWCGCGNLVHTIIIIWFGNKRKKESESGD